MHLGPLLPVVVVDDPARARPLGEALREGGITHVEVTLRTAKALDAIRELSDIDGLVVGAGTVLTPAQADGAVDAGARFLVSPGFDPALVEPAARRGVPWIPGIATPTEAMAARNRGITTLKVFPVAQLGGVPFVDALSAVFPECSFIPSGGIASHEAASYLKHRAIDTVGGSWLAPRAAIADGDVKSIRNACRRSIEALS